MFLNICKYKKKKIKCEFISWIDCSNQPYVLLTLIKIKLLNTCDISLIKKKDKKIPVIIWKIIKKTKKKLKTE